MALDWRTIKPIPSSTPEEREQRRMSWDQTKDRIDLARANKLRAEYGRVKWLVSWGEFEPGIVDGMWLARVSCPTLDATFEAIHNTRSDAINAATWVCTAALEKARLEEQAAEKALYINHTSKNEGDGQPC